MSKVTKEQRDRIQYQLDCLEMAAFNEGFEAALNGIEELSNKYHNEGETIIAEILRQTVKEMLGESV